MSASNRILYLKIEQNCIVTQRKVTMQDIAKIECADIGILRQVKQMDFFYFSGSEKKDFVQVFSILKVIQRIHEKYPSLDIENLGEADFVIRFVPVPEKKALQYGKVAILCAVLFFGSALTIMTFIEDVSMAKVFDNFYQRVTGNEAAGITSLEVFFCIGLAVGIMVFYNHIGHKKITDDPTPIQVAMRKYEQDVDTTFIESSSRKGKSNDVDG